MTSALSTILWSASSASPEWDGDVDLVTPGVIGFVITFLIAVATVFLILDMSRRVRRTRYRGEIREQLQREQALDAEAADAPAEDPGEPDADEPPKAPVDR